MLESPLTDSGISSPLDTGPKLFVWSAANKDSLRRLIKDYSHHFADLTGKESQQYFESLAYTLYARRSALPWKSYVVADGTSKLQTLDEVISEPLRSLTSETKLGFVFTGQGAQWYAMGRELSTYAVFSDSLLRSQDCLTKLGCKWSLAGTLSSFLLCW